MSDFFGGDSSPIHATPGEGHDVTLTEDEQRLVTKLLGDPTYFPIEFRRWLKDYIENSDLRISAGQVIGGGGGGGSAQATQLPAGIILPYAGTVVGADVLICNGAAVSRSDYASLYEAIHSTWGNGDGTTTFNVPDLRDRALYGSGSVIAVAQTDGKTLGNRGGPSHNHTVSGNTGSAGGHNHGASTSVSIGSGPNHQHVYDRPGTTSIQQGTAGGFVGVADNTFSGQNVSSGGAHGHSASASTSIGSVGDHSHSFSGTSSGGGDRDRPSFAGVMYCITTGKSA